MARIGGYAGDGVLFTVTLTEEATINGRDYGGKQTMIFNDIKDIQRRIATITTTETTIANFSTTVSAGQYITGDVRYIRISNLDETNHVILTFKDENNGEHAIKLDKGMYWFYSGDKSGGMANVIDANQNELQFTDATCDYVGSSTTVACDSSSKIKVGQYIAVSSPAITNNQVTAVNTVGAVTSFTMSAESPGSGDNRSTTFTNSLLDLSSITAEADTDSVDLEVYIASV